MKNIRRLAKLPRPDQAILDDQHLTRDCAEALSLLLTPAIDDDAEAARRVALSRLLRRIVDLRPFDSRARQAKKQLAVEMLAVDAHARGELSMAAQLAIAVLREPADHY
jgi:hypothetical protein